MEGWFTAGDGQVRLLGTRCTSCGTPYFPRNELACRNPRCTGPKDGSELQEHALSGRGRIWSYADSRYKPPPPYISPDPFRPYAVAAVELEAERMVVLGQVAPGHTVDDLAVGMEVELTEGVLYEDDEAEYTTWMWIPKRSPRGASGASQ
ncbi:benzoylsuccinyl-CoA thiolase [Actinomadura rubrisoli]|uniref:Benzoylsuccinyl-CoA thiolase n=1 Tax=Actinomadura rubrisoli TaxID=2530368 RepID=A0A4R5B7P1_9ACTN|nr:benzoylsuccinyl-CoA thiolase [Actinomadura rubrisoli]